MNIAHHQCTFRSNAFAMLLGMSAALLALPVNTATAQSFPDYPLLAGREGVPPNILFILDDSGSMRSLSMGRLNDNGGDITNYASDDTAYKGSGLADNPSERSYVNNSIYYKPSVDYLPWKNADGSRKPNATITALSPSVMGLANEGVSTTGTRNLVGNDDSVFYVPKAGIANPGTNAANYTRYWIASVNGQARVVRAGPDEREILYTYQIPNIGVSNSYTLDSINVSDAPKQLRFELSGGSGDAKMEVTRPGRTAPWCKDNNTSGNDETCTIDQADVLTGNWKVVVINTKSNGGNNNAVKNAVLQVVAVNPGAVAETPSGRGQSDELQNIANWYQYHRTRIKVAKAGASEAFSRLGDTYRVGFDTIWNRAKDSTVNGSTTGNLPSMPIPVSKEKGLFKGDNRSDWFDFLQSASANQGTPLHGALSRAGRYYSTYGKGTSNDPWGNGSATDKPLACRASYAILTTDGYWNSDSGYSPEAGDADGDKVADTLADVAMNYYKKDLRGDITDNVPVDRSNRRHQRMTTFGVSIGLKGSLDGPPNAPPNTWPNPWPTSKGEWSKESNKRIDDLWHAAVNTEGAFVVASSTEDFAKALEDAFKSIDGRQASGSNLASNGPQVTAGSYKYSAIYHSSEWWGDLRAFPRDVSSDGYSDTPTWRLSETVNADSLFTARPVLSSLQSKAGTFKTLYASDTRFQRANVTIADNLNYLTGVRALEDGVNFRRRKLSPIGDIVNSSPVYANDNGYLFIGANDGMLHGVNSMNGKVAFSYVPQGINMGAMASLSNPTYEHRFMVDGQIAVNKIRERGDKNYLVGALGRGGKGVFALDVTDPAKMTKNQVVWDATFQSGGDRDMGYVLGNPAARRLQDGKMVALVPNGFESESGSAALFVYDLDSSNAAPTKLVAALGPNNGLMVIEPADFDADGRVDVVYGGDLKGNIWRWDFRNTTMSAAKLIFTATGPTGLPQPITGGLTVVRDGSGQIFVAFGTGRLITEADLPWNNAQGSEPQSIYGIIDNMSSDGTEKIANAVAATPQRYSQLKKRTIPFVGKDSKGRDARSFEFYSALPDDKRGWYLDLGVPSPFADTERVVSTPVAVGRALWIDSVWPSRGDGCEATTGNGFMNALDIFTGTNSSYSAYGTNTTGQGTFSLIDVDGDGVGGDRLSDTRGMGDQEGFITSVSHGAFMGRPDVSDKEVCTQLDDGRVVCEKRTPAGEAAAERLMWRELYRTN